MLGPSDREAKHFTLQHVKPFVYQSRRRQRKRCSTTSGAQSLKTPPRKEALYLEGSIKHKRRQAAYCTLVNPMDKNPDPKFCGLPALEALHHAIYVVDMERAQEEQFKFFQALNGCVICFDTIPKECLKRVSFIYVNEAGT